MTVRRALTAFAVVAVVVALVLALVRRGRELADHLHELSVWSLGLASAAVLAALWCSMLAWRALLADVGSPLPLRAAARVFFLSQLGKYVPGSVWPVLAQMELGKEHHVPRSRSAAVGLINLALSVLAGLLVAVLSLPFTGREVLDRYWWGFAVIPVLAVGLVPRVANAVLAKLLTLARREPPRPLSGRGLLTGLGWCALAWVLFGLQVAALAGSLGAGPVAVPLSIGAFSLAWTIGFLVVVAPAGAGVREAALVVTLSPVLSSSEALLVALVSRALTTLGDAVTAGLAVLSARRHPQPAEPLPAEEPTLP